jgi:hypothetical protein
VLLCELSFCPFPACFFGNSMANKHAIRSYCIRQCAKWLELGNFDKNIYHIPYTVDDFPQTRGFSLIIFWGYLYVIHILTLNPKISKSEWYLNPNISKSEWYLNQNDI